MAGLSGSGSFVDLQQRRQSLQIRPNGPGLGFRDKRVGETSEYSAESGICVNAIGVARAGIVRPKCW
jgi:hypothetical protein